MELNSIAAALDRLCTASPQPDVFGAQHHGFALNPPLAAEEVAAFERKHKVRLPADYRRFLIEVGNGGAGPSYGLLPLGLRMDIRSLVPWEENDEVVGILSEPFPHSRPWYDLRGQPTEEDEDDDQYDEKMNSFYKRYFTPAYINGALPLSDLGCALSQWLVVTGPEVGHVWCDYRSDCRGILPLSIAGAARVGFLQWYSFWLEEALAQLPSEQRG